MELCPICRGRGEIAAGITTGIIEYGPVTIGHDWKGKEVEIRCCEPVAYRVNPDAWYPNLKDVWLLESNPHGKLWE